MLSIYNNQFNHIRFRYNILGSDNMLGLDSMLDSDNMLGSDNGHTDICGYRMNKSLLYIF